MAAEPAISIQLNTSHRTRRALAAVCLLITAACGGGSGDEGDDGGDGEATGKVHVGGGTPPRPRGPAPAVTPMPAPPSSPNGPSPAGGDGGSGGGDPSDGSEPRSALTAVKNSVQSLGVLHLAIDAAAVSGRFYRIVVKRDGSVLATGFGDDTAAGFVDDAADGASISRQIAVWPWVADRILRGDSEIVELHVGDDADGTATPAGATEVRIADVAGGAFLGVGAAPIATAGPAHDDLVGGFVAIGGSPASATRPMTTTYPVLWSD